MSRGRRQRGERGFTLIELMVAMMVLVIGMTGLLALQMSGNRAAAYARHAAEAAVLAEDRIEALRTVPLASATGGEDRIDAMGVPDPGGLYQRSWSITWNGDLGSLVVRVAWLERGAEPHQISYRTLRNR
jgi:type IV pilus assembly protein PilV